jgi:hypothetical protein
MDERTKKMEYYTSIRKDEILSLAAIWMDLQDFMLSKIRYTERQIPCDLSYMGNLKILTLKKY